MDFDPEPKWTRQYRPREQFKAFLREWMEMYLNLPSPTDMKLRIQAKDLIMADLRGLPSVVPALKELEFEVQDKSKDIRIKHPDQYARRQRELYIYKVLRDLHIEIFEKEFRSPIDRDGDHIMYYIYDAQGNLRRPLRI